MYPPKNGPIAISKRLHIPTNQIPDIDPNDELLGDSVNFNSVKNKYQQHNLQLAMMGFEDITKNLRYLMKLDDLQKVVEIFTESVKYENVYIGDRVIRGDHWKWGDQDGGKGLKGTICGLRQWHPKDPADKITEVVVLWDHGLYGNYRFGYKSAYDIKVIHRQKEDTLNTRNMNIGERVQRYKKNWRWGDQDGGIGYGTIIELYAIPTHDFECDTVVSVLWDHQKDKYKQLAQNYYDQNLKDDDNEFGFDKFDEKEYDLVNDVHEGDLYLNVSEKFRNCVINPHKTGKSKQMKAEMEKADLEWEEPDFDEILSRPIPQYRLKSGEIELIESANLKGNEYLRIGDSVSKGMGFKKNSGKTQSDRAIVIKVEQKDGRCVSGNDIRGDRVWTSWSRSKSFLFSNDGLNEIVFSKRGNNEKHGNLNGIKVGDRVKRQNECGTVVGLQGIFKINGMIGKIIWETTYHVNYYSLGYKNIYDLKKVESDSNYVSFLHKESMISEPGSSDAMFVKYDNIKPSAPIKENGSIDEKDEYQDVLPSAPLMDSL